VCGHQSPLVSYVELQYTREPVFLEHILMKNSVARHYESDSFVDKSRTLKTVHTVHTSRSKPEQGGRGAGQQVHRVAPPSQVISQNRLVCSTEYQVTGSSDRMRGRPPAFRPAWRTDDSPPAGAADHRPLLSRIIPVVLMTNC
jgi:hypothetical protein